MYSDPGLDHGRIRDRLRSDPYAECDTTGSLIRNPSSHETLNNLEQLSPQRAAYSEGEWNADDTDSGGTQDWELRSTVAKLKRMSLRTLRLWR